MIPLFRCRNMPAAIAFYTGILDFELKNRELLRMTGLFF